MGNQFYKFKNLLIFSGVIFILAFSTSVAQSDEVLNNTLQKKIWKKRISFSAGTGVKYYLCEPEKYILKREKYDASAVYFVNFGIYLSKYENDLLGIELKEFNFPENQRENGQPAFLLSSYFKRYYPITDKISLSPEINFSAGTLVETSFMPGIGLGVEYTTENFNFFIKSSNSIVSLVSIVDRIPLPQFILSGVSVKL